MLHVTMIILSTIYVPICNLTYERSELGTSYKESLLNQASTMAMPLMRRTTREAPLVKDVSVAK